jgi:hypothetical protein
MKNEELFCPIEIVVPVERIKLKFRAQTNFFVSSYLQLQMAAKIRTEKQNLPIFCALF